MLDICTLEHIIYYYLLFIFNFLIVLEYLVLKFIIEGNNNDLHLETI